MSKNQSNLLPHQTNPTPPLPLPLNRPPNTTPYKYLNTNTHTNTHTHTNNNNNAHRNSQQQLRHKLEQLRKGRCVTQFGTSVERIERELTGEGGAGGAGTGGGGARGEYEGNGRGLGYGNGKQLQGRVSSDNIVEQWKLQKQAIDKYNAASKKQPSLDIQTKAIQQQNNIVQSNPKTTPTHPKPPKTHPKIPPNPTIHPAPPITATKTPKIPHTPTQPSKQQHIHLQAQKLQLQRLAARELEQHCNSEIVCIGAGIGVGVGGQLDGGNGGDTGEGLEGWAVGGTARNFFGCSVYSYMGKRGQMSEVVTPKNMYNTKKVDNTKNTIDNRHCKSTNQCYHNQKDKIKKTQATHTQKQTRSASRINIQNLQFNIDNQPRDKINTSRPHSKKNLANSNSNSNCTKTRSNNQLTTTNHFFKQLKLKYAKINRQKEREREREREKQRELQRSRVLKNYGSNDSYFKLSEQKQGQGQRQGQREVNQRSNYHHGDFSFSRWCESKYICYGNQYGSKEKNKGNRNSKSNSNQKPKQKFPKYKDHPQTTPTTHPFPQPNPKFTPIPPSTHPHPHHHQNNPTPHHRSLFKFQPANTIDKIITQPSNLTLGSDVLPNSITSARAGAGGAVDRGYIGYREAKGRAGRGRRNFSEGNQRFNRLLNLSSNCYFVDGGNTSSRRQALQLKRQKSSLVKIRLKYLKTLKMSYNPHLNIIQPQTLQKAKITPTNRQAPHKPSFPSQPTLTTHPTNPTHPTNLTNPTIPIQHTPPPKKTNPVSHNHSHNHNHNHSHNHNHNRKSEKSYKPLYSQGCGEAEGLWSDRIAVRGGEHYERLRELMRREGNGVQ